MSSIFYARNSLLVKTQGTRFKPHRLAATWAGSWERSQARVATFRVTGEAGRVARSSAHGAALADMLAGQLDNLPNRLKGHNGGQVGSSGGQHRCNPRNGLLPCQIFARGESAIIGGSSGRLIFSRYNCGEIWHRTDSYAKGLVVAVLEAAGIWSGAIGLRAGAFQVPRNRWIGFRVGLDQG